MRLTATPALAVAILLSPAITQAQTEWQGFARTDIELTTSAGAEFHGVVIAPREAAPGRPWIWRARFFGHQPQTEIALLRRGFHVVYADVAGLFGNDEALRRWAACYSHVTEQLRLHRRPALLGMSRGGLIALRWAAVNPQRVACIYVDAPVCDIRSWPGGKMTGKGSPSEWRRCLAAHHLDATTAANWRGNPIDQLAPLARADIPILSICGRADRVVPFAENTAVVATRYRALGGHIRVIEKAGVGHHPHSLADPTPIVNFVLRHTIGSGDYFVLRSGLSRCRAQFEDNSRGRVAYLGGSITHNPGWRDLVSEQLRQRFPKTKFEFINAGIASFGSTPGAFRLHRDVLAKGRVDLLFVEAAVNDATNGRTGEAMTRGMEGIVRQALRSNPQLDIVMLHFVDPSKMQQIDRGRVPLVIQRHEAVADHYGVASIDLALEVTERIAAGEFSWQKDFRNLHPAPFGQRLYAATIGRLFRRAWRRRETTPPPLPLPRPIDPLCYSRGQMIAPGHARRLTGFALDKAWRPKVRAGTRSGFVNVPMLTAEQPGAALEFSFTGRAVGILTPAGPDAGQIEFSIDDAPFRTLDLFTRWSHALYLPWSYVLAANLTDAPHRLRLRVGAKHHAKSRGHAVRIAWFLVNGAE